MQLSRFLVADQPTRTSYANGAGIIMIAQIVIIGCRNYHSGCGMGINQSCDQQIQSCVDHISYYYGLQPRDHGSPRKLDRWDSR